MADWQFRRDTRDPLEQLIERESRTCKGCIHRSTLCGAAVCIKLNKLADLKCSKYKGAE